MDFSKREKGSVESEIDIKNGIPLFIDWYKSYTFK